MYLKTILTAVTPQMFAAEYALPGSIREAEGTIYCDFKNIGTMCIHSGGFIAAHLSTSLMKAGSIVDVLAASGYSDRSYYNAVKSIVTKFEAILPVGMSDDAIIDFTAKEALAKRRVFNIAVCSSDSPESLPGSLVLKANKDLAGVMQLGCVSYLSARKMQQLKSRLEDIGVNEDFPCVSALVVPYFSYCHEIACIEIIYGSGVENSIIWLTGHNVALSCLLATRESDEFFLETNTGAAMRDMRDSMESRIAFVSMRIQPDGKEIGWIPTRFCFVDRGEPMGLLVPSLLVRAGASCIVTQYPSLHGTKTAGSRSWGDAVAEAVIRLLDAEKDFTPRVMCLLETVRGDRIVKATIKGYLHEKGEYWLSNKLDTVLREGIIWQGKTGSVYATASGYIYEDDKNRDVGGEPVTNFTIIPLRSIMYEGGEMYYECQVDTRGEVRNVILGSASFDTIKKMVDHIQRFIALSGKPTAMTPMIFDQVHGRPLIPYLQRQFAELPVLSGISFLGWNGTRTAFIGPDFKSGERVDYKPNVFKPEISYLSYFEAKEERLKVSNMATDVPAALLNIIKQCAGFIVRSYANHDIRPITYTNNKTARDVVQAMFSYAGQKRAVQLNQNMRSSGELVCFQGYPFLAIGYNRSQAKAVKTGMILLGEEGPVIDNYSHNECKAAGMLLRHVLEKLPAWLVSNCGPSFTPTAGAIEPEDLANEGWLAMQEIL